jgi:hypothetical protein
MSTFHRGVIPGQRCGFPMDPEGVSTFERIAVVSHL